MSVPAEHFEAMYAREPDPWGFTTRWYERRKYALTLAALPRPRYGSAFEPGCSIGVLTGALAARCDRLLAADAAPSAVRAARDRLAAHPHVAVEQLVVPAQWPGHGGFDLVVLSELGYYLDRADLAALVDAAVGSLAPGGDLLAVHWRRAVAGCPLRGDEVHAALAARPELHRLSRHVEADFLVEVFTAGPPRSVAAIEGLC